MNTTIPIKKISTFFNFGKEFANLKLNKYVNNKKSNLSYYKCDYILHIINFNPILCYKIISVYDNLSGVWESFVDAKTGEIVEIKDISSHVEVDGKGYVFYPNPISSLRGIYGSGGLIDDDDNTNITLNNARIEVDLLSIDFENGIYRLKGPKAQITNLFPPNTGLFEQTSPNFYFNRQEDGFEAVMCYYTIDRNMRYVNTTLQLPNIKPTAYANGLKFDPHGQEGDVSLYGPIIQEVTFGVGGVDGGEDAHIILHEVGHFIHDIVTGGSNAHSRKEGLSEGFSDYWAMSDANSIRQFKDYEQGFYNVGSWDGHNEFYIGTACNNPRLYKNYGTLTDTHDSGQFFSTILTKIYLDIGKERADRAILEGMALAISPTKQPQAAEFIYQAAVDLNYTNPELCIIWNHFKDFFGQYFNKPEPQGSKDFYLKDDYYDFGMEINTSSQLLYLSEDIWVRNNDDNDPNHQNPEYKVNSPNYVYVKIRGRGCSAISNAKLHLFWSKASTGLKWPYSWTYSSNDPNTCTINTSSGPKPCGGEITSGLNIPSNIKAGEEIILKFPWFPPNPALYDNVNDHHFCLYARIVSNEDPMYSNEITDVWQNAKNNNNIAWRNVSIFDLDPNNFGYPDETISVYVNDVDDVAGPTKLEFTNSTKPLYGKVLDNGELYIVLNEPLRSIWNAGGKQSNGIIETEDNRIKIISLPASLSNLNLDLLTYYKIDVQFEGLNTIKPFSFELLQSNSLNQIIGGEEFLYPGSGNNILPRKSTNENSRINDFDILPNPSNEYFVLNSNIPLSNIKFSILNLNGEVILSKLHLNNEKELIRLVIEWPNHAKSGIYFLKLESEELKSNNIFKIIKIN